MCAIFETRPMRVSVGLRVVRVHRRQLDRRAVERCLQNSPVAYIVQCVDESRRHNPLWCEVISLTTRRPAAPIPKESLTQVTRFMCVSGARSSKPANLRRLGPDELLHHALARHTCDARIPKRALRPSDPRQVTSALAAHTGLCAGSRS